jgi:hypothetical protein
MAAWGAEDGAARSLRLRPANASAGAEPSSANLRLKTSQN